MIWNMKKVNPLRRATAANSILLCLLKEAIRILLMLLTDRTNATF